MGTAKEPNAIAEITAAIQPQFSAPVASQVGRTELPHVLLLPSLIFQQVQNILMFRIVVVGIKCLVGWLID